MRKAPKVPKNSYSVYDIRGGLIDRIEELAKAELQRLDIEVEAKRISSSQYHRQSKICYEIIGNMIGFRHAHKSKPYVKRSV